MPFIIWAVEKTSNFYQIWRPVWLLKTSNFSRKKPRNPVRLGGCLDRKKPRISVRNCCLENFVVIGKWSFKVRFRSSFEVYWKILRTKIHFSLSFFRFLFGDARITSDSLDHSKMDSGDRFRRTFSKYFELNVKFGGRFTGNIFWRFDSEGRNCILAWWIHNSATIILAYDFFLEHKIF